MKRGEGPKRDPAKLRAWEERTRAKTRAAQKARGISRVPRPPKAERLKRAPKRWREGREGKCACCPRRSSLHPHHVVYAQHVEGAGGDVWDPRNRLMLCEGCHADHHGPNWRVPLLLLPDRCIAFAVELLGAAAFDYLTRRYDGEDPRVAAILDQA